MTITRPTHESSTPSLAHAPLLLCALVFGAQLPQHKPIMCSCADVPTPLGIKEPAHKRMRLEECPGSSTAPSFVASPHDARKRNVSTKRKVQTIHTDKKEVPPYVPYISESVHNTFDVGAIVDSLISDADELQVDVVRVDFCGPTGGDTKKNIVLSSTHSGNTGPRSRYTVHTLSAHITPPRDPISAKKGERSAALLYMLGPSEEAVFRGFSEAVREVKEFLAESGLLPSDMTVRCSDGSALRKVRVLVFSFDKVVNNGDLLRLVPDVDSHLPYISTSYLHRCMAEHIFFTFRGTVVSSAERPDAVDTEAHVGAQVLRPTNFFRFVSAASDMRGAIFTGLQRAIAVMKAGVASARSGVPQQKLYQWLQHAACTTKISVLRLDSFLTDNYESVGVVRWASEASQSCTPFVGQSSSSRSADHLKETVFFTLPQPAQNDCSSSRTLPFLENVYPLAAPETEALSSIARSLGDFFLSPQRLQSNATQWIIMLPSPEAILPRIGSDEALLTNVDWGAVMRFVPITLMHTVSEVRRVLESRNAFATYADTWPASLRLVPPEYSGADLFSPLSIGIENLPEPH